MANEFTLNQKLDYKNWYLDKPEQGFSPERNKEVIEQSIVKSKLLLERRQRDYIEQIRERADAVASYLKRVANGMEMNVDQYFGRRELARLRGEKIVQELQGRTRRLFSKDSG